MKSWYRIEAKANEADIYIYDEIGFFGITANQFVKELNELKVAKINLRINTPGGSVFDGFAIYNSLQKHKAKVVTYVDGLAASIGSLIALAGDTVIMAENAFFMIHNPHVMAGGEAEDLRKTAETLDKIAKAIVDIYAAKSNKDEEEIHALMDDETWFNAEETVGVGFADSIEGKNDEKAQFDLSVFTKVPENIKEDFSGDTPTKRELESVLRDAGGLSQTRARAVLSEGYSSVVQRDAETGTQRDAGEKQTTIKKGGKNKMETCEHCKVELSAGMACNCAGAIAARTASPLPASTGEVDAKIVIATNEARNAEVARTSEIMAIGDAHKCPDLARQFIQNGKPVDDFKSAVLEKVHGAIPVTDMSPNIGMSAKEIKLFSVVKAIRTLAGNRPLEGLEKEVSDAAAKLAGKTSQGFFMPHDVMHNDIRNDLSAGDATKGGYTVGTEVLGGSMIGLLQNKMVVSRLGATNLTGLVGNIAIPRITSGGQAYWLPETGEVSKSDQGFGSLGLTPHRIAADTAYSKELMMQSSIDVESFVRNDLIRKIALEKDRVAFNGTGANGEPTGIINTTGIKTVTFGATPTWGKVVDFETQIADANADVDKMSYVTTPSVRGTLKTASKATNQAIFLWEKGLERGVGDINGYPAYATNQVPDNKVVFGNFEDLILADWAGMDIVVDSVTLKKTGQIEVTLTMWTDIGVRHAVSFCVSTDAGNQ